MTISDKTVRVSATEQIPAIMSEMQAAADTLQEIGQGVSIFGSARITPDSPYYALSEQLGKSLALAGLPVIAGGGPGIMEAANKGAYNAGGKSIGLNIKLPNEKKPNLYQTHSLHFEYFVSRKATFFMHSCAYIALPGGFGTLDEIFEVLTLIQTGKIAPVPVFLMGARFWSGMLDWVTDQLLSNKLINDNFREMLTISDDVDAVTQRIQTFYTNHIEQLGHNATMPG